MLLLLSACESPRAEAGSGRPASSAAYLEPPVPRPDVTLTDVHGNDFNLASDTQDFVTLLFFGYTHCPDVCPVHMANIAAVLRDLPRDFSERIKVVFVTTDPERDTPGRLAGWLEALHPRFVGLRAPPNVLAGLEDQLGLPRSVVGLDEVTGEPVVAHAAQVLAFPAHGGPAEIAFPWGTRQRDWALELPRLVEAGFADAGRF